MRDSSGNHSDFYTTHTHEAAGDRPRASLPDTFRKSFAVVRLQKLYGPQAAAVPLFQVFSLSGFQQAPLASRLVETQLP